MAFENVNQDYEYRDGDSEGDYFNRNLQSQLTDPTFYMGGSIGQTIKGFRGRSDYKRKRKDYERRMRNQSILDREHAYRNYQTDQDLQAQIDDQKRQAAVTALEQGFADPSRTAARYAAYNANLGNEVAGLNAGYRDSSQRAAQEARRRGRLGSSTDAEKQSALGTSLRSGILTAENSANDQLSALEDSDERQLQALRRSLLTGDPQAQMTYRAQASQASGDIGRILEQGADQQRRRQEAAQAEFQRYQAYGGLANAAATGAYSYFGSPQYGTYQ